MPAWMMARKQYQFFDVQGTGSCQTCARMALASANPFCFGLGVFSHTWNYGTCAIGTRWAMTECHRYIFEKQSRAYAVCIKSTTSHRILRCAADKALNKVVGSSTRAGAKIFHQPAYILHSQAHSETSLILDVFTRNHGRLLVIAKGAFASLHALACEYFSKPFKPWQWASQAKARCARCSMRSGSVGFRCCKVGR